MEQVKNLVNDLTMVQRISVGIAVLLTAGTIAAVVHYRTESDFRALYTGMAPEDAAPVVQKLRESGVDYRLADNGASVLVPSEHLADSRLTLASAGLPKSGRIGFELFDKTNFGASELVEHVNYQRALEGELERSVMSMEGVVQARVHLTFPRESVFLDQQEAAKASVMVRLRPGTHLSAQNVTALCNLAASAVEGLSPDAVAVIDMDGNLLSHPKRSGQTGDAGVTTEALEVRQSIERDLVAKINATLEPLLGADQFRAGASVDCDLTSGEQEEETYNPDQSVMVSSQKSEDDNERGTTAAGGVPGTAANLPQTKTASSGGGSSHRTENVTYQTSRIVRHTRIPQGVVRKMSLSVLVGQPFKWEGSGKSRHQVVVPPSQDTLQKIHDLVAGVTGLDPNRGDQLIVETLPFETNVIADTMQQAMPVMPTGKSTNDNLPPWLEKINQYRNLVFMAVGGLIALSVLLKLIVRYMPRRGSAPVERRAPSIERMNEELEELAQRHAMNRETPPPVAGAAVGDKVVLGTGAQPLLAEVNAETAERIRILAQKDPAASANVIRMWLSNQKA